MSRRFLLLYPLLFLIVGLIFHIVAEHEFQRRVTRDNAEMRQDLQEAGVSRVETAALMSAQTKLQENASSFVEITSFVSLITAAMLAIPLYAQLGRGALK